jgi:hypothetical protein
MVERRGFFDGGAKRVIPIEDRTGQYLKMKNKGSFKVKGKHKRRKFDIGKTVWLQQSDNSEKIILIEEILWYNGKREVRFGYRTTDAKGRWWWGEKALVAPIQDIKELINYAKEKSIL